MNVIELENWVPSKEDPRKLEYAGQPTAAEVFEELKYRLESMGYLPDEYFLMDSEWENGREIPQDADIFCTTDYGASEGVYLDVYLKWHEDGKPVAMSFITGKTLGENGNDLDRMFLISSAITKAFHGDNATHARFMQVDGQRDTGGSVVHLSMTEQKVIVNALLSQLERQRGTIHQTEELLRRMTGSITDYIDLMGERPSHLNDFDMAVLAIRDEELKTFKRLLENIREPDKLGALLVDAAARPGEVGRKMTVLLLAEPMKFPQDFYESACEKAVYSKDPEKIALLIEQSADHAEWLNPRVLYELAYESYTYHARNVAQRIIEACSREQVAQMPEGLFKQAIRDGDIWFVEQMVEKGFEMTSSPAQLLQQIQESNRWIIEHMLGKGIRVDPQDYGSLKACVERGFTKLGTRLLDLGVDFDGFRQQVEGQDLLTGTETFRSLAEHWDDMHPPEVEQEQPQEQSM